MRLNEQILQKKIKEFYQQSCLNGSQFHRYKSWEHCYQAFNDPKNKNNIDLLALHLSMYLASWGMYRGSSFLLELDYKVNLPVAELIKKTDEKCKIAHVSIDKLEAQSDVILSLADRISETYKNTISLTKKTNMKGHLKVNPTDTLTSKILLGTLGCTIAYDSYARKTLGAHGVPLRFNQASLSEVGRLFSPYKATLKKIRKDIPYLKGYPDLKLIDMYCFKKGYAD